MAGSSTSLLSLLCPVEEFHYSELPTPQKAHAVHSSFFRVCKPQSVEPTLVLVRLTHARGTGTTDFRRMVLGRRSGSIRTDNSQKLIFGQRPRDRTVVGGNFPCCWCKEDGIFFCLWCVCVSSWSEMATTLRKFGNWQPLELTNDVGTFVPGGLFLHPQHPPPPDGCNFLTCGGGGCGVVGVDGWTTDCQCPEITVIGVVLPWHDAGGCGMLLFFTEWLP